MRKLIKLGVVAMLTACVAGFSSAATLINTGFKASDTPAYANGDLAGQNGWAVNSIVATNAFNVIDAAGNGFADTTGTTLSTNGNYVYYTTAVGNGASNELSGSLDFTLGSSVASLAGGDIFRLGISATVTNSLNTGDTNQVVLSVATTGAGIIKIQTKEGTNAAITLCQMPAAEAGWSTTEVPLPLTDSLRLTWKIRTTAVADTYVLSATLTNLVNASTNATGNSSLMRADAYAAGAPYFMMGHASGAFSTNNNGTIDITIDNLSVTNTTDVAPTLFPKAVLANPGDVRVDLSWGLVVEAETLDIQRSTTTATGTYTTIAGSLAGTTTTYTDTTVTNGSTYYYKVVWKNGAVEASSDPVIAEPNAAITGLILNTSFRNTDSPAYATGDLAGQNKWKSIAASGAPAFYVDSTGNGFAKTAPYSNYFDNVNGNQVYLNEIMSNGVGAAWSGTTVFTLSATPEVAETKIKTNSVDGVDTVTTNTQQVAVMMSGRVFELGITSDSTVVLNPNDKKSTMLITGRSTTSGGLNVLLNGYNATVNLMIEVPRPNLGWDPEWSGTNAAPKFETDPITLNWAIRKTASNNVYSGSASLTVGTNSYTGSVQFSDETATASVNLYTNPVARFAMSHSFASQTSSTSTMVNVSIDSLSLSHTNDAPIMIAAPFGLSGVVGNTNILLRWQGAVEASSFDIYRSVDYGSTNYVLRGTVTNVWSWLDTGLTDLMLYNYKVVAKYASASNTSYAVSIRARGKVDYLVWDAVGKVAVNPAVLAQTNRVIVTNVNGSVVANIYGNYTNGAIVGAGYADYSGIPVYGVVQVTGSLAVTSMKMTTVAFEEVSANKGLTASNRVSALMYIPATNGPIDMTVKSYTYDYLSAASCNLRAAFRDSASGKWYVSDNTGSNVASTAALSIANLADPTNQWRELTVTQNTLMSGTNNPVTTPDFTSVDAIGFMVDNTTANFKPTLLKVSVVSPLPTFTISNLTTDVRGSVENSTATPTNNPLVVSYGDSPVFTITATNGFRVATVKTGGVDVVGMTLDNDSTKVDFTWTNVTANGTLAATFTERFYTLTVTNGTGAGMVVTNVVVTNEVGMVVTNEVSTGAYTNGVAVDILANTAPAGMVFAYWTGNTNQLANTNVYVASTTVTIPTRNIQLTANYITPSYQLIVNLGTGDGWYTNGTPVTIVANDPDVVGEVFLGWTGDTGVLVSNTASTTFSTTNYPLTLTATYGQSSITLTGIVVSGQGTISPTSTNVAPGANVTFVLTANPYYRIATLTTNGTAVTGMSFDNGSTTTNFIWTNVQAAGTAAVTFVEQVTIGQPPVPYAWLAQYFTTNDYNACAEADQDGDGVKTKNEYIAGTLPNNAASVLKAAQTTFRSNLNVITWTAQTNRIYSVYSSTNLVKGFALKQDNLSYATNNATGSYTNTAPDGRLNHYQIRVRMQ